MQSRVQGTQHTKLSYCGLNTVNLWNWNVCSLLKNFPRVWHLMFRIFHKWKLIFDATSSHIIYPPLEYFIFGKRECKSMPRKPSIGILKARVLVLGFNERNAATKSEAFLPSNRSADIRVKRSMGGALKQSSRTHMCSAWKDRSNR